MAFALYASVNDVVTQLNDGAPFRLEHAEGLSGGPVTRLGQRGPLQGGITDLGYRLQPRTITLDLIFTAADDAALDSYRDQLLDTFKPLENISIFLTVQRDDGEIRILTCYTTDEIAIALAPELRPGHTHRATVQLRAANPLYKANTIQAGTLTYAGSTLYWWRGGTVIGSANVLEQVESPSQGQAWTYTGTVTGSWSIAFRSGSVPLAGTPVAYHAGTGSMLADSVDARFYGGTSSFSGVSPFWRVGASDLSGPTSMYAGTVNYFAVMDVDAGGAGIGLQRVYTDNGTVFLEDVITHDYNIAGTTRRWRSDRAGSTHTYWPTSIPRAAIYNIALSAAERNALSTWLNGTAIIGTVTTVNGGDVEASPIIYLYGPLQDPILTNVTTGAVLDLRGITVAASDIYTVDLRDGDKYIADLNNNSKMSGLVNPASLVGWGIVPAPIATGGTNTIRVQAGGTVTTSTKVVIQNQDLYTSF